jgi:hypothetical protein
MSADRRMRRLDVAGSGPLAVVLGAVLGAALMIGACSDDDGKNIPPKTAAGAGGETATAGSGGGAGTAGGAGVGGGAGTAGSAGSAGMSGGAGTGSTEMPDASLGPSNCANPPDAGVDFLDAGVAILPDGGDGGATLSFAKDIHPIFNTKCTPCHVTLTSGGHNIGADDVNVAYCYAIQLAPDVLELTKDGIMPPSYADPPNNCMGGLDSPGCLTTAQYDLIQRWIAQGYPR